MSRVKENENLVTLLKETNMEREDRINILLADISVSLAVIADSLRKQEMELPYIHVDPELTKEAEKEWKRILRKNVVHPVGGDGE